MATDYIGIATLVSSLTASVVAGVGLWRSRANGKALVEVHDLVNDLSDKRDAATQKSAHAEGMIAGAEAEREHPTPG